ncbi:putative lipoate-protein ligase B [Dunaliella salina]|uniref:lipoyl(octanoyl) transferase n=1 Tax=Dunaliella salina TaxID=3046 RepID=A0ABQ7H1S5_DUNSA|nr:putative lipoate-protein ligase B [Dunaliella salina]|eukprot:KAF5840809.1 putative lipoate-protein ligase B [Dunaliella salina]
MRIDVFDGPMLDGCCPTSHWHQTSIATSRISRVRQRRQWRQAARLHGDASGFTCQAARACRLYDLHDQTIPYQQAWDWQHRELQRILAEKADDGQGSDALFIMQHQPVYTLGTGSSEGHLLFDPTSSTIPLYRTERGGEVTYHGPGQLVIYPLLHLGAPKSQVPKDLHLYMRSLEEVVIRALSEVSGLRGERVEGLTGVWVGQHKLAAIGVRAKQWVTYHGLAVNICPDLRPFAAIVPCGISDRPVGSVAQQLGRPHPRTLSVQIDEAGFPSESSGTEGGTLAMEDDEGNQLLQEYRYALLEAFEAVFGLKLMLAGSMDLSLEPKHC